MAQARHDLAPLAEDDGTLAVPAASGVFRRVASGGHADLLVVERAYDPRRRRLRSEIVVEDTREIAAFLRLTAAEGGWRVVIVDGADEMNRSAANALLKILEEPPRRALLLLVAHSPGRLLPTIRSRCRRFPMTPLPPSVVSRLLETRRPDLPQAQSAALVALRGRQHRPRARACGSRRGRSLSRGSGAVVARAGRRSRRAACIGRPAGARRSRGRLSRRRGTPVALLGEIAVVAAGGSSGGQSCLEADAVLRRLAGRAPAARWAELREEIAASFARADALNLDRKQTILGAFFAIERTGALESARHRGVLAGSAGALLDGTGRAPISGPWRAS